MCLTALNVAIIGWLIRSIEQRPTQETRCQNRSRLEAQRLPLRLGATDGQF